MVWGPEIIEINQKNPKNSNRKRIGIPWNPWFSGVLARPWSCSHTAHGTGQLGFGLILLARRPGKILTCYGYWFLYFICVFDFCLDIKTVFWSPGYHIYIYIYLSIRMTIYLYQLFCCSSEFRFNSFSRWRKIGSNVPCLHECHRMLGPAAWKVGHSRSMEKEISKSCEYPLVI